MTETEYLNHLDQINWEEFHTPELAHWPHDIWCNPEVCKLDGDHCETFDRHHRDNALEAEQAVEGSLIIYSLRLAS